MAGSLQSKQNTGFSEQQQRYLFQTNVVIPHNTSQQAHARLANYTSTSVTVVNTASAKCTRDLCHTSINMASAFVTLQLACVMGGMREQASRAHGLA